MNTYAAQTNWREIQQFLPDAYQLKPGQEPVEEWWPWRQHRLHLDCFRNPAAPLKVILFHGVGTNGRQMSTILGAPLARKGFETIAVDMPEYGVTQVGRGKPVTYDDWVRAGSDLIDAELAKDGRPIVLYGLSAGGMETYHVAALNQKVKGIIGMTFLDQREQKVRDETSYNFFMSRIGVPLAKLAARTPFAGMRIPMAMASKMYALVNNRAALKVCLDDKTSAGKWVTMAFLSSYMGYSPAMEPETFSVCPILLTQPDLDKWTPFHLSEIFLNRIQTVPVTVKTLTNAGHYPIEQPGLDEMVESIYSFCNSVLADAHL
ncbi:alpha/beta hydrolase [Pseudomonas yamanorum]|uniref:alpha/beta hydrolase n=1 Tax=Pseudomonas yamanorum TaxID=515393 RepID=UPI003D3667F3